MSPTLIEGEFVFCSFKNAHYGDHVNMQPIAAISEKEGLSLVIPRSIADQQNIDYDSLFRGITLEVHSSLEAVGLTAAFASKLAEHGISANVVAGFYHDHIFVQSRYATKAMLALSEMRC